MPKLAREAEAIPAISDLLAAPEVRQALDFLKQNNGFSDDELIAICEIAAPPFKEGQRAQYVARRLRELDFGDVLIDDVGNVIATRAGAGAEPRAVMNNNNSMDDKSRGCTGH